MAIGGRPERSAERRALRIHLWVQCPLTLLRVQNTLRVQCVVTDKDVGHVMGRLQEVPSEFVAERAWEAKVFTPDSCPSLVYVEFELTTSRWR